MKINVLIAAFATTAAASVPPSNITVAIPLQPNCLTLSLTWSLTAINFLSFLNTFEFDVKEPNGNTRYNMFMETFGVSNGNMRTDCYKDGVWCVEYSNRAKSDKLTLYYANRAFVYEAPHQRVPIRQYAGDKFYYVGCI
ncbi:hypothetical protein BGW39_003177 [Mortierella sp. 14UC]|nr:hypothetical protein BGW39_003177 [Mortierella sp. 14UC]